MVKKDIVCISTTSSITAKKKEKKKKIKRNLILDLFFDLKNKNEK